MLFDDPLLTGLYAVPFLASLALPGWRSLLAAGLIGAAVTAWTFATAGGGVASALGLVFVMVMAAGLGCGLVTRAMTLRFAPLGHRPFGFLAVAVAGFVLPPAAMAGPAAVWASLTRPSLHTCAAATFRLRVADRILHVPAAPIFAVEVRRGTSSPGLGGYLSFGNERSLRDLCAQSVRDGEVVGPAVLSLYPWMLAGSSAGRWAASICTRPRGRAEALLCDLTDKNHPGRQIERATIYGAEVSSMVDRAVTFEVEQTIRDWLVAGRSVDPARPTEQAGDFEIAPDGLRIARGPDWAGPAGQPFGLVCSDKSSDPGERVLCAAAGVLDGGILVRFTIRARRDRINADTLAVRAYLNDLVRELASAPAADTGGQASSTAKPLPTRNGRLRPDGARAILAESAAGEAAGRGRCATRRCWWR